MIKELSGKEVLDSLSYSNIYEGKIKTLYLSYGVENRFCTFLSQNNSLLISKLDRDFVINVYNEEYNIEELSAYLNFCNPHSVFTTPELLRKLEPYINGEYRYNCIMEYFGEHVPAEINDKPNLTDVFNILKEYFYIEYSSWLTDVSHRVRHNISKVFLYNNHSTVTALYDNDNMVFLTQVATREAERGNGYAKNMLREVAGRYKAQGKSVSLVCRSAMVEFYTKLGFRKTGEAAQVYTVVR